ncbi:SprT-like domain-containing protein [Parasegetibacter sp. NRK P23]|uniref:SprT-like domain-containing protein n=1 Tax=Parasegetibacter sp. NRK P23 TaxID=2942999 RepID=UPI0020430508|nr:SprT-like domain-containing protein [Parasegetibacter sp. NRK P23]MCM5528553.1 SprT-like domain-containing protein [Parasegetibacter sp. NRK P23]
MAKQEAPLEALRSYLPHGSFEQVQHYLLHYKVHLTITRARKSVLGDYRNAVNEKNHRISVNGNLNRYAFLVTLLHELAHLLTFDRYGHRVAPHGKEWKTLFSHILAEFIRLNVFPADITKALLDSLGNPAASSCADEQLLRVLRRYDPVKDGHVLVDELPIGALFTIEKGRIFKRGEKIRKRIRCEEMATGKIYLFSPVYEVMKA